MWREGTLAELVGESGLIQTGPFGSQLHAREYAASGWAVVMPQDIRQGRLDPRAMARIPEAVARHLLRHHLVVDDIVFSRRGDVEKSARVSESDLPAICGTGCLLVRMGPDCEVDAKFLAYRLQARDARVWLRSHAVGATMPNLNTSILSALPLTFPARGEQQAIAEVLGALDDKIAANDRLVATSHELAATLQVQTLQGELQEARYEDFGAVGGGGTPSTKESRFWDGSIQWTSPTDITALSAPYLYGTAKRITEEGLKACSSRLYPSGSILMTSRATIGAFAVNQIPVAVNQGFIVVTPADERHTWWLFHEMQRRVPEYLSRANGATFKEISRGTFKDLTLEVPCDEVLNEFHDTADALHQRAMAATKESRTLAELRDTLLPALMDGTIRVKDAINKAEEVL